MEKSTSWADRYAKGALSMSMSFRFERNAIARRKMSPHINRRDITYKLFVLIHKQKPPEKDTMLILIPSGGKK